MTNLKNKEVGMRVASQTNYPFLHTWLSYVTFHNNQLTVSSVELWALKSAMILPRIYVGFFGEAWYKSLFSSTSLDSLQYALLVDVAISHIIHEIFAVSQACYIIREWNDTNDCLRMSKVTWNISLEELILWHLVVNITVSYARRCVCSPVSSKI